MNDKTTTLGGILSDQATDEAQKTAKYRAVALDRLSKQGVTDPSQIDEFVNFMKNAEKSNLAKPLKSSDSAGEMITDRLMKQASVEGSDVAKYDDELANFMKNIKKSNLAKPQSVAASGAEQGLSKRLMSRAAKGGADIFGNPELAWSDVPKSSIVEKAVEAPQRFGLLRKGLGLAGRALASPTSMGVMELTRSEDLGPTEGIGAALESGQKLSPEQIAQLKTENIESQEDLRERESRRKRFDNLRNKYGRDLASFDVNDVEDSQPNYGRAIRNLTTKQKRLGE